MRLLLLCCMILVGSLNVGCNSGNDRKGLKDLKTVETNILALANESVAFAEKVQAIEQKVEAAKATAEDVKAEYANASTNQEKSSAILKARIAFRGSEDEVSVYKQDELDALKAKIEKAESDTKDFKSKDIDDNLKKANAAYQQTKASVEKFNTALALIKVVDEEMQKHVAAAVSKAQLQEPPERRMKREKIETLQQAIDEAKAKLAKAEQEAAHAKQAKNEIKETIKDINAIGDSDDNLNAAAQKLAEVLSEQSDKNSALSVVKKNKTFEEKKEELQKQASTKFEKYTKAHKEAEQKLSEANSEKVAAQEALKKLDENEALTAAKEKLKEFETKKQNINESGTTEIFKSNKLQYVDNLYDMLSDDYDKNEKEPLKIVIETYKSSGKRVDDQTKLKKGFEKALSVLHKRLTNEVELAKKPRQDAEIKSKEAEALYEKAFEAEKKAKEKKEKHEKIVQAIVSATEETLRAVANQWLGEAITNAVYVSDNNTSVEALKALAEKASKAANESYNNAKAVIAEAKKEEETAQTELESLEAESKPKEKPLQINNEAELVFGGHFAMLKILFADNLWQNESKKTMWVANDLAEKAEANIFHHYFNTKAEEGNGEEAEANSLAQEIAVVIGQINKVEPTSIIEHKGANWELPIAIVNMIDGISKLVKIDQSSQLKAHKEMILNSSDELNAAYKK